MNEQDSQEVVDAEIVRDDALVLVEEPPARPRVDKDTVLRPGQAIATTADPSTQYTERSQSRCQKPRTMIGPGPLPGVPGRIRTCDTRFRSSIRVLADRVLTRSERTRRAGHGRLRPGLLMSAVDVRPRGAGDVRPLLAAAVPRRR
ncbi:hypothetical protein GCM10011428_18620 [Streptomyces violaceus]